MAVDNPSVIDFIGITSENKISLTISDHLEWNNDNDHLFHLENKISSYLEIIDNNQIYHIYPNANGREIIIQIYFKYVPNKEGQLFLDKVADFFRSKNLEFNYQIEN